MSLWPRLGHVMRCRGADLSLVGDEGDGSCTGESWRVTRRAEGTRRISPRERCGASRALGALLGVEFADRTLATHSTRGMPRSDPKDPLKFAIVERFVNEASQKYHLEVRSFPNLADLPLPLPRPLLLRTLAQHPPCCSALANFHSPRAHHMPCRTPTGSLSTPSSFPCWMALWTSLAGRSWRSRSRIRIRPSLGRGRRRRCRAARKGKQTSVTFSLERRRVVRVAAVEE